MTRSIQPYLALILRSLTRIQEYQPASETEFLESSMAQDATLMRLQEIGEILTKVRQLDHGLFSDRSRDSWRKMIGLRIVISPGYDSIEISQIWQIPAEELPVFTKTIDALVEGDNG